MASVLITGTSKGIGLETALTFGRAGYKVYATMRTPSQAPELAERAAREKLPIAISAMDVNSDESVRDGIAAILKDGPIDVLVNNAGIERAGSVEELPIAEVRAVMETNYFGVLRCVQAIVPTMRKRKSGCIINVASVAGQICSPPLTSYCASKWAMEALSEGLAGEMKTFGVRVLIVEPGIIDTAMARRIGNGSGESLYRQGARMASMFTQTLENPAPPSLVAEKIFEIAETGTWKVRHPVGPDAMPLLQWRLGMSDEDWVDLYASDDEEWARRMQANSVADAEPVK
jgi:NAD(P)-dependent dehydrogenase (short-subunit alcohol dehydrogenase family)